MSERMVLCVKLGEKLPGLEKAPFPGRVGALIYEKVSAKAWAMWEKDMQIKVLNEYRLNMSDPKDYQTMIDQMLAFLGISQAEVLEVENEQRGKEDK
ncbi:oxidative damage protection protein [Oligoflexia bacterium]|nr:oxidative damage protection protein [Oligoflexia bacterium]